MKMKIALSTILLLTISVVGADSRSKRAIRRSSCGMAAEQGLCKGYMTRYYYDSKGEVCRDFVYGGCGGNENNFRSLEDCQSHCSGFRKKRSSWDRCALPVLSGFCKAAIKRFHFNPDSLRCESFLYGGCGGNQNNFRSLEDCRNACKDF
uniref:U52-Liphistoxin-Lth1a_1 n=1 Tax=Liphistius thaleban TaxID=1905330 RepID=A0A4Q8K3J5_9ARAC